MSNNTDKMGLAIDEGRKGVGIRALTATSAKMGTAAADMSQDRSEGTQHQKEYFTIKTREYSATIILGEEADSAIARSLHSNKHIPILMQGDLVSPATSLQALNAVKKMNVRQASMLVELPLGPASLAAHLKQAMLDVIGNNVEYVVPRGAAGSEEKDAPGPGTTSTDAAADLYRCKMLAGVHFPEATSRSLFEKLLEGNKCKTTIIQGSIEAGVDSLGDLCDTLIADEQAHLLRLIAEDIAICREELDSMEKAGAVSGDNVGLKDDYKYQHYLKNLRDLKSLQARAIDSSGSALVTLWSIYFARRTTEVEYERRVRRLLDSAGTGAVTVSFPRVIWDTDHYDAGVAASLWVKLVNLIACVHTGTAARVDLVGDIRDVCYSCIGDVMEGGGGGVAEGGNYVHNVTAANALWQEINSVLKKMAVVEGRAAQARRAESAQRSTSPPGQTVREKVLASLACMEAPAVNLRTKLDSANRKASEYSEKVAGKSKSTEGAKATAAATARATYGSDDSESEDDDVDYNPDSNFFDTAEHEAMHLSIVDVLIDLSYEGHKLLAIDAEHALYPIIAEGENGGPPCVHFQVMRIKDKDTLEHYASRGFISALGDLSKFSQEGAKDFLLRVSASGLDPHSFPRRAIRAIQRALRPTAVITDGQVFASDNYIASRVTNEDKKTTMAIETIIATNAVLILSKYSGFQAFMVGADGKPITKDTSEEDRAGANVDIQKVMGAGIQVHALIVKAMKTSKGAQKALLGRYFAHSYVGDDVTKMQSAQAAFEPYSNMVEANRSSLRALSFTFKRSLTDYVMQRCPGNGMIGRAEVACKSSYKLCADKGSGTSVAMRTKKNEFGLSDVSPTSAKYQLAPGRKSTDAIADGDWFDALSAFECNSKKPRDLGFIERNTKICKVEVALCLSNMSSSEDDTSKAKLYFSLGKAHSLVNGTSRGSAETINMPHHNFLSLNTEKFFNMLMLVPEMFQSMSDAFKQHCKLNSGHIIMGGRSAEKFWLMVKSSGVEITIEDAREFLACFAYLGGHAVDLRLMMARNYIKCAEDGWLFSASKRLSPMGPGQIAPSLINRLGADAAEHNYWTVIGKEAEWDNFKNHFEVYNKVAWMHLPYAKHLYGVARPPDTVLEAFAIPIYAALAGYDEVNKDSSYNKSISLKREVSKAAGNSLLGSKDLRNFASIMNSISRQEMKGKIESMGGYKRLELTNNTETSMIRYGDL